ncbi:OmpA family protein [Paracoccus siganidrum]|uniref:OmpA family protein n=1 Tax=Paracoccus siganidrum TaxID=1276757 RepID=A0A419A7K6_9RHOB|nr:OmpA family protein [Paracoccus siganidrum]RJL16551.1 OmpA family protein [Paracoccus siganidrum]RMC29478.1 flagellar motor protein MotB [Paracoccus siganidrum]
MRRIIHNSTAIVACLAILAPDFALAQQQPPRRDQLQQQQDDAPQRAVGREEGQGEEGGGEDDRAGQDEQAQQQEEQSRQEERQRRQQERQAQQDEQVQEREGRQQERRQRQEAEQQAERDEAQERRRQERQERQAEEQRQAEEEEQRAAEREQERADEEAREREEAQQRESQAEEERRAEEEREEQHRLEERLEEEQREQQAEEQRQDERRERQAEERRQDEQRERQAEDQEDELRRRLEESQQQEAGQGRLGLAQGDQARQRAGNMPGLGRVLNDEIEGGLSTDQLRCLAGGAPPCADGGPMVTPQGVVVATNPRGELLLAPAAQQMNRVDGEGRIVPRAAEEDVRETQSALEAAQERAARRAAALEEREAQGRIFEQLITEQNSRSSSEDFATSLRDALAGANGQTRARDDDDDDSGSDLTKALVLGLGALAVGSMLNNNRQVALSSPDRVVVTRPDGSQEVIKDEVALLRQPGSTVTTENFDDGSSRTVVSRPDGSRVVTIRDADLRVLRRTLISADGRSTQLIDDTAEVDPVDVASLPAPAPVPSGTSSMDEEALAAALRREAEVNRHFTLGQIRNIPEVRALVPPINIDAITFDTGSAAITPDQARQLSTLGHVIQEAIAENPREIFLIEGHTDTVGSDAMNLALSDRRAESVALALSEYFDVPPENLVAQGYGEQFLKVRAEGDIRENRRASVRRITDLLQASQN